MAWALAALAVSALAASAKESPLEHVTNLLQELELQVQNDGAASAAAYDEFACFCKTNHDSKTGAISDGEADLATYTANLKEYEGQRQELAKEILALELTLDERDAEMKKMTDLRENEKAVFTVAAQDAGIAITQLTDAIAAIEAGGEAPMGDDALLQIKASVVPAMETGARMGLPAAALLAKVTTQGAHDDLLGALDKLKTGFEARKTEVEEQETATVTSFSSAMDAKRTEHDTDESSLATKKGLLETAESDIAQAKTDISETSETLADDKKYLKELTYECEAKAKEWDQEASMRKNELEALGKALEILTGDAAVTADTAGEGLVQRRTTVKAKAAAPAPHRRSSTKVNSGHHLPFHHPAGLMQLPAGSDQYEDFTDVVFVQRSSLTKRERVAAVLRRQPALAVVAEKVEAGDPFAKVKVVIQGLIETLITAAKDEAEHKGQCDTNMETARTDRLHRQEAVSALNNQIEGEEARKAELEFRLEELDEQISVLDAALLAVTQQRQAEKDVNKQTIQEAQNGIDAIKSAITLLQDFYRNSGRAKVAEQAQVPTSAVQDDKGDAGVAGPTGKAYQGNQGGAAKVLGMLKVVEADYTRARDETQAAEDQAARDFTAFKKETEASISAKRTAHANTDNELTRTNGDLEAHVEELRTEQGLVDAALRVLEDLKPACLYTGMSYEEHKRRREEEIATLKYAVCVLDDDGSEAGLRCDDLLLPPTTTAAPAFLQRQAVARPVA